MRLELSDRLPFREQRDLIVSKWVALVRAARAAHMNEHALLGVLGALLAKFLAAMPAHVSREWISDLEEHVEVLRNRRNLSETAPDTVFEKD